jgi:hypothetical protein
VTPQRIQPIPQLNCLLTDHKDRLCACPACAGQWFHLGQVHGPIVQVRQSERFEIRDPVTDHAKHVGWQRGIGLVICMGCAIAGTSSVFDLDRGGEQVTLERAGRDQIKNEAPRQDQRLDETIDYGLTLNQPATSQAKSSALPPL